MPTPSWPQSFPALSQFLRANCTPPLSGSNLSLTALLLPAVSQPGRVFFTTNASYYIKITGNLSWNISFYGNWDNQPPANLPGSNYGTSSGLSWTFGPSLRTTPRTVQ